jgi:histidyl-tRNA synthetase
MSDNKPSIPKGTRDFTPKEMVRRNYIFRSIENTFKLFGFQPIETPAMENLSTLLGKYGEEGDKLLFRVLNSGDFLSGIEKEDILNSSLAALSSKLCDRGLRYDLTVPFARFVVQHRNEITFPFRRFQIQPVWRADRPQKGRYREFYQCDADVIGSDSLINEAELIQIIDTVFSDLNMRVLIKLNNRKILAGIAELIGKADLLSKITVAIDKLDKLGIDAVLEELRSGGLDEREIEILSPLFDLKGENSEKIIFLRKYLGKSEIGQKGLDELVEVLRLASLTRLNCPLELDITLARGLNYYTGAIIEVKTSEMDMGSICGGGRYDDLTGIFGMPGVSGVGISFGADRIYDVLLHLNRFPLEAELNTKVMFVNFGSKEIDYVIPVIAVLRSLGISAEIYPETAKMKKQLSYADAKNIPFVILAGEEEIKTQTLTLKNMKTGGQERIELGNLTERFNKLL